VAGDKNETIPIDAKAEVSSSPYEDIELKAGRQWNEERDLLEDDSFHPSFDYSGGQDDIRTFLDNQRLAQEEADDKFLKDNDHKLSERIIMFTKEEEREEGKIFGYNQYCVSVDDVL